MRRFTDADRRDTGPGARSDDTGRERTSRRRSARQVRFYLLKKTPHPRHIGFENPSAQEQCRERLSISARRSGRHTADQIA